MTERAIARVVIKRLGALWFIGVLLLSFAALYAIITTHGPDMAQQLRTNGDRSLTLINIVSLLLITVVSATEIPYDITGRVLLVVLAKPIRRYQYVAGKFMGVAAVGLIYCALCLLFTMIALLCMGHWPDAEFFRHGMVIVLRVFVAAGFATLLSASFSEVPTIAGCIAGGIFSFATNLFAMMLLKSDFPQTVKIVFSPLLYCLPSLNTLSAPPTALGDFIMGRQRNLNAIDSVSLDSILDTTAQSIPLSVLYSAAYTLIFLSIAIISFHRTEKVE